MAGIYPRIENTTLPVENAPTNQMAGIYPRIAPVKPSDKPTLIDMTADNPQPIPRTDYATDGAGIGENEIIRDYSKMINLAPMNEQAAINDILNQPIVKSNQPPYFQTFPVGGEANAAVPPVVSQDGQTRPRIAPNQLITDETANASTRPRIALTENIQVPAEHLHQWANNLSGEQVAALSKLEPLADKWDSLPQESRDEAIDSIQNLRPSQKTQQEINRRENKDFSDKDKDIWDALRSAGLGAVMGFLKGGLGGAIGGGIVGLVGGAVDRNFDEKLGNKFNLENLYAQKAQQQKNEYEDLRQENVRLDNARSDETAKSLIESRKQA